MNPANLLQLELTTAFTNGRSLFMRFGLTFLLCFPFVFLDMPLEIQTTGIAILLLFISFFGAAVSVTRKRREGHLERLRLLPLSPWLIGVDLMLSSVCIDFLQIGVPLTFFLLLRVGGVAFDHILVLVGYLFASR